MNLANWITLLRIVLTPVFIISLFYHRLLLALIIFIICALTDLFDGFIARKKGQKTYLGAVLDPLADKLLLTASFAVLARLGLMPLWLAIIVVSRDVIISLGIGVIHMTTGNLPIAPSLLGKSTTTAQLIMVSLTLLRSNLSWPSHSFLAVISYPVAGLTVLSGLHYMYQGTKLFNGK